MIETFEQKLRRAFLAIQGIAIPDVPEEIMAMEKEMNGRYPNTQVVTQIICKNALLAADVLTLANSPAMRPKQPIQSIAQAVAVLGTKNLKNMVIASALKQALGSAETIREIMDHSVDVAYCMAELAYFVHGVSPDEAYLCGLFHNCGAFLLAAKNASAYGDVFFQSHSLPITSIEKEEAIFKTNHAVVGVLMAKKWQLSAEMVQAIYDHHIEQCDRITADKVSVLVGLLKVANGIVADTSLGAYIGEEMTNYLEDGMDVLMLSKANIKEVRMALQTYAAVGTN